MRKVILVAVLVFLASTLTLWAGGSKEKGAKKELYFACVYKGVHPWFNLGGEGFKDAAEAIGGIKTRIAAPTEWSGEAQSKLVEDLITEGVDGIAISVFDIVALTPTINRAMEAGIPVITWDSDAPESNRIMFIGTDNPAAGKLEGETFVKLTGGKAKYVIFVPDLVSPNIKQRVQAIREVVKDYHDIKEIMSEQSTEYGMEKALATAENILAAFPDLTDVVNVAMEGAAAFYKTLKERGFPPGKIIILGWTTLPDNLASVKDGYITASLHQNPYAMGYLSCYALKWAIDGLKPDIDTFDSGIILATKENIDIVYELNKKKTPGMLEELKKHWK